MASYRVNLIREPDGKWSAIVPDVQGAHTWGRSKEEALEHAKEAIGSILDLADDEAMELEPWVYDSGSLVPEDRSEEEGPPAPEPRPPSDSENAE